MSAGSSLWLSSWQKSEIGLWPLVAQAAWSGGWSLGGLAMVSDFKPRAPQFELLEERQKSLKPSCKPEEPAGEDPVPEIPRKFWKELEVRHRLENCLHGRLTPSPSFHTWDGKTSPGAPNRMLHNWGNSNLERFRDSVSSSPRKFQRDVNRKRAKLEETGAFYSLMARVQKWMVSSLAETSGD